MHEMAIVRDVVETVLDKAEAEQATKVREVYLTVGQARDIVEDLFEGLFKYLARDTVAADAQIVIQSVPFTVKCENCGLVYHLDVHDRRTWSCPTCASRKYRLHSGMEFSIDSIVVETGSDTTPDPEAYSTVAQRSQSDNAA